MVCTNIEGVYLDYTRKDEFTCVITITNLLLPASTRMQTKQQY